MTINYEKPAERIFFVQLNNNRPGLCKYHLATWIPSTRAEYEASSEHVHDLVKYQAYFEENRTTNDLEIFKG